MPVVDYRMSRKLISKDAPDDAHPRPNPIVWQDERKSGPTKDRKSSLFRAKWTLIEISKARLRTLIPRMDKYLRPLVRLLKPDVRSAASPHRMKEK